MKVFGFVLLATIFEAVGDAIIRVALHHPSLRMRIALLLSGTLLLGLYGTSLNLAPVDFATVTGIYVATLFVVFQIANFLFFHTLPTTGVTLGGMLIVAGGFVISRWG